MIRGVELPSRAELRTSLSGFTEVEKKVVGGVLAAMFASPERVRDREWVVEQFTQVALLTGQFEDAGAAHEGVEAARAWVRAHIDSALNACFALFVHVADDMRQRHGEATFSASDAMIQALGYFDPPPSEGA